MAKITLKDAYVSVGGNDISSDVKSVSIDDLSGQHQVQLYKAVTSPVGLIRNEELILIAAEANIGTDNTAAVNAINIIRASAGLGDYAGGMGRNV